MAKLQALQSTRGPFLILAPVCVLLGVGAASYSGYDIHTRDLILVFLGALMAHISVNTFNEYCDFKSGLDLNTNKTPFSGGSGALGAHPENASMVLGLAWTSLVITGLIGLYFVVQYGLGILPLGVLGLVIVLSYTEWITRSPLLCLIAPGLGFGLLMVAGTHFALSGEYSTLVWVVAAVPFFLTNNLLLLNQYPDIEPDREVGRYHFPIAYGTKASTVVYGLFVASAVAVIVVAVLQDLLPVLSLVALLPIPLAVLAMIGAFRHGDAIARHPGLLAANVGVSILTPALLGVSLLVQA